VISFDLTNEQQQLKETCRRFAEKEIKPLATGIDQISNPREAFPRDLIQKGFELGFHTLLVPKEYGGMEGGLVDFSIMMEELAAGDAGVAFSFAVTCAVSRMIAANGTREQCERWLVPFCKDKTGTFSLGFGATEPSGGTEIFYADTDPRFGTKTTARKTEDGYIIKGYAPTKKDPTSHPTQSSFSLPTRRGSQSARSKTRWAIEPPATGSLSSTV
jgi:alkylation response protein AidB-like acyl-CoA dehydrogenase